MAGDNDIKIAEHGVEIKYIKDKLDDEIKNRKDADKALADAQKLQSEGLQQVSKRVLVITTVLGVLWTAINFAPKLLAVFGL